METLAHRGPDAHGIHHKPLEGLVMGHTRLSIIDPDARSDQPFIADFVTLVFNGEIYNFRQLQRELRNQGIQLKTNGDTEVLAEGYKAWGIEIFSKIRGMFAIALYDAREDRLHLVRDDFGIKPLVFHLHEGNVLFGSEAKAIANFRSLAINETVLVEQLCWGFQMTNESLYKGVHFLPPGTRTTFKRRNGNCEHLETVCLWAPSDSYRQSLRDISAEELRSVLTESVDQHLIADVPIAVALSGGLDSSIVATAAAKIHPALHAFTFTLSSKPDAEVHHARILSQQLGLKHTIGRLLPVELEGWLRQVAWHLEEPIVNINALPGYGLASLVRSSGMKVVLVGEGADELFGGYPWYRYALDARNDPGSTFDSYKARRAQTGILRILRDEARALAQSRFADQRIQFVSQDIDDRLNRFLAFDQTTQLQYSQLLRVDRTFMAHGVEARVPFLDRKVHEASARMPSSRKIVDVKATGRSEKTGLAEAFDQLLPRQISLRPKFGCSGTVNLWESWVTEGLGREFDRCVNSVALEGARQMLDRCIDWKKVSSETLTPKEQFTLCLVIEAVDSVLISKSMPDQSPQLRWEVIESSLE